MTYEIRALKGKITRRDKKIAALVEENREARAALREAVRLCKQTAADNRALRNNIEVLSRPKHKARRDSLAADALETLRVIKCLHKSAGIAIEHYEHSQRKSL